MSQSGVSQSSSCTDASSSFNPLKRISLAHVANGQSMSRNSTNVPQPFVFTVSFGECDRGDGQSLYKGPGRGTCSAARLQRGLLVPWSALRRLGWRGPLEATSLIVRGKYGCSRTLTLSPFCEILLMSLNLLSLQFPLAGATDRACTRVQGVALAVPPGCSEGC